MKHTILVTGATGNVGRHLVRELAQAGHEVRALTRDPARADFGDPVLGENVAVVAGDLSRPQTLASALEGVSGLHLINFDSADGDYRMLGTGPQIIEMAKAAGVRRVSVLLGGEKGSIENAVAESGLQWAYLQPVEFMANMLEWADSIRAEGVVREAFGNRLSAVVHEADIAAVAAAVLTEDGHTGQTYTLTGPQVLTPPQMVQIIGQAIGRELRFVELTKEEAIARWQAQGYPHEVIEFFLWAHGNTPESGYTVVPTVEQIGRRPARTFAQWAQEHADRFR